MEYHGKIIKYENTTEFYLALPSRNAFIDKKANIGKVINNNKLILFLPNDILEKHVKVGSSSYKTLEYKLILIGILRDGSKAAVILDGIKPFYDIKLPDDIHESIFLEKFLVYLKKNKLYIDSNEIINKYPFKYFQEQKSKYIRLYFNTTFARTKSLNYILANDFEYYNDNGTKISIRLQTASDDLSCYYRKVAREYKFKLCNWNIIKDYKIDTSENIMKKQCIKWTFNVDVKNFIDIKQLNKPIDIQSDTKKYVDLIKDKSMIGVWDIETDSSNPTGNAPLPENVFDTNGAEDDVIRMQSNVFYWYWDMYNPLVKVNFTDMICPARDDCMIVLCANQIEIIKAQALLLERMCPEFYSGFNDGVYDWPFILRRAEHYDQVKDTNIIDFMKKHMSVVKWTPDNAQYVIKGAKKEDFKVEAGVTISNEFFKVPGFICIDVRTIFRLLYPTAEKTSLSFFLAANKLGSKEDMPYQTMFKIFRLMRHLCIFTGENTYEKIMAKMTEIRIIHGDEYKPFKSDQNIFKNIDNSIYNIYDISISNIFILAEQATQVVHYCNIDAQRCQELLNIRCIITDKREIANLAHISMYDAYVRAGGMKVRNLVISEGIKPEWDIVFTNISREKKDGRKYPGAYVVPPKKGLYRDHISTKRKRREAYIASGANTDLLDSNFNEIYPPTSSEKQNNDTNDKTDRPCSGLDFKSLYPSIIMTINLSPEKLIENKEFMEKLSNKIDKYGFQYKFIEVDFRYGLPDQAEDEKERIHGWFVQHHPIEDENKKIIKYEGMGLYPTILKQLFDQRRNIKKKMEYYQFPKEFLDKVFESRKLSMLSNDSIEDQKSYVFNYIEKEVTKRQADFDKFGKNFYKYKLIAIGVIKVFLEKEWKNENIKIFYDEICFQFNYLNVKQNALKVFMNTFYGEAGNSQSSFFIPHVAGGTTTYGQKNLKMVKTFIEGKGCEVKYGDSVTADTPILCKRSDQTYIYRTIDELANNWTIVDYGLDTEGNKITKEHADCLEPLKVWTYNGWNNINKVIRHKTNKKIYRIVTNLGSVDVTEDHSLLDHNQKKIKPLECDIGTILLHNRLPTIDVSINISQKNAYEMGINGDISDEIINSSDLTKSIFLESYDLTHKKDKNKLRNAKLYYLKNYNNSVINIDDCKIKKINLLNNTDQYVYDLETENHQFSAGVGQIIVHNTDSLYPSPPDSYYEKIDALYEQNKITKLEYWTQMVEMTMEFMHKLAAEVGELLYADNGTRYLEMDIEDVLWPYMLVGKKKYMGIKHEGIVNFHACMKDCTLEEFINSKTLFIRGLELKKRGSSQFLKLVCYEIVKDAFCIESTKTLKELVESKLKELSNRSWNPELFIKSAKYKLPGKNLETGKDKPGNVAVQTFARRMREVEEKNPELGIRCPELGERFNYIVAKKYPWYHDLRGRKKNTQVGQKYEYFESIKNENYSNLLGVPLEIDIDYYILNETIGQFSRFIIYHTEYDKFFNESMYENDEAYKEADKKAHNYAKKKLQDYYKERYASKYVEKGHIYKNLFKNTNNALLDVLDEKYGGVSVIFNITSTITTGSDISKIDIHIKKKIKDKLIEKAKQYGEKLAEIYITEISKKLKLNPFKLYKIYIASKNSIYKLRKINLNLMLVNLMKELNNLMPVFQDLCSKNNMLLEDVITNIISDKKIDSIGIVPTKDKNQEINIEIDTDEIDDLVQEKYDEKAEDNENTEDDNNILRIYSVYISIAAVYKNLIELEYIKKEIQCLKAKTVGVTAMPSSITIENIKTDKSKSTSNEFAEWIKKNEKYKYV